MFSTMELRNSLSFQLTGVCVQRKLEEYVVTKSSIILISRRDIRERAMLVI